MTIALATRGYLCGGFRMDPAIPPPTMHVSSQEPIISDVRADRGQPPSITSAKMHTPVVRGAETSPPASVPSSPTITGAVSQAPVIRKVKKD